MGGEGLVWANCINLSVRIIWSWKFITIWYADLSGAVEWNRVVPSRRTIASSLLVGLGVRIICTRYVYGFLEAVCLAGVSGLSLVGCMYFPEFPG